MSPDTGVTRQQARRAALLQKLGTARPAQEVLEPCPQGSGIAPASYGQEGLWFIDQLDPDNARYSVPLAFRFRGELAVAALRQALDALLARQAALRTTFVDDDGEPRQKVTAPSEVPLQVTDLSTLPEEEQAAELQRCLDAEAQRGFDLATGPLFVASLLVMGPGDHILLLNVHHIVFDGWSLGIVVRELCELYGAAVQGRPPRLEPQAMEYADYARWERDWLRGDESRAQAAYWRRQLARVPHLELPADRPRPAVASVDGASLRFALPEELRAAVVRVSAEEHVTPFMLFLAVFQTVLARGTGQPDVAVGTPMANRPLPGTQQLVGYFVNSVVLRTDLSSAGTFREVLRRVREVALGAYENQTYPFARVVAELVPGRDPGRPPLFQVMFVMHEESWEQAQWPGLTVESLEFPAETSVFDVTLVVMLSGHGISGEINFRTDLFELSSMKRLADEFTQVLQRVLHHPAEDMKTLLS
ncbi:condensation domain-containing protein [Streptomyces diacarni]|uniref:condensation domain-containing protein n=1 Tax=Streptomyces diacarni TaxID=2800381 RepID=UPI0034047DBE